MSQRIELDQRYIGPRLIAYAVLQHIQVFSAKFDSARSDLIPFVHQTKFKFAFFYHHIAFPSTATGAASCRTDQNRNFASSRTAVLSIPGAYTGHSAFP